MSYTVKDVSRLSSVSVRTLHHYDEIDLLKPAYCGDNGYRYYEQYQLIRLQQILFFRELEFSLVDIKKILDSSTFNQLEALSEQRKLLEMKTERLNKLMETIDYTMEHLKGETKMSNHKIEQLYEGFDKQKQKAYERELVERYGPDTQKSIDATNEKVKGWDGQKFNVLNHEWELLLAEMAQAMQAGEEFTGERVQQITERHFKWLTNFYVPTAEVYTGLGQMYAEHDDFQRKIEAVVPGLANFLRDAMAFYAEQHLA
ncbi:MerR family transcriptional regulator [Paenibacillus sp. 481]|uniref:MerR family transcriptional regulator n=1 Tax=Paenibacillus sp. 481 TaxID=2835869 RepID=UPI001E49C0BB|nr:MerR family transcriptional regulator [Paenibacillus sp. 481]UHA74387.1 MerR family transcriptional regulator [Paenibacillus sp. 481]